MINADAEAYQVYSALIPELSPNPETKTWFIRTDTLPIGGSLGRDGYHGVSPTKNLLRVID
jgi:hypothetical protein